MNKLQELMKASLSFPWTIDNCDWPVIITSEDDPNEPVALYELPKDSDGDDEIGTKHWNSAILCTHIMNAFPNVLAVLQRCQEILANETYDSLNGPQPCHPEIVADIQKILYDAPDVVI
jgi:hypothetical protein